MNTTATTVMIESVYGVEAAFVVVSAGDLWEGKRQYVIRTLGRFRTEEQVKDVIVAQSNNSCVGVTCGAAESCAAGRCLPGCARFTASR